MIARADNQRAITSTDKTHASGEKGSQPFLGFEPLNSNYVYCPNQFLDICLKSNSRGMVRSVAFILRQTLGWLDANGQPINQTVRVPYTRLINEAGVSERAIPKAISLALASGFIHCDVSPTPDRKEQAGAAGEYTLKWDQSGMHTKSFSDFDGFYIGEGHRSPIPNSFFDIVIPNETLSVTKVVGAILRHTIGYENQFGGRRMSHPLSCTSLQNYTGLSDRKTVVSAIRHAVDAGYIERIQEGQFHPNKNVQTAAVYGVKWLAKTNVHATTAKTPTVNNDGNNPTSTTARTPTANHRKNPNSIETTKLKDTLKQQAAVNQDSIIQQRLVAEGFEPAAAVKLIEKRGLDIASRQLDWLDERKPKNRLAMLRKAIEEDWAESTTFQAKKKIAEARKRDAAKAIAKQVEDRFIEERKQQRQDRKQRLMTEWGIASDAERANWIASAVARESSTAIRKILAKLEPQTEKPHVQVLDEIAFERGLEPVTLIRNIDEPTSVAEQPRQSKLAPSSRLQIPIRNSPPKEKMPTELASF